MKCWINNPKYSVVLNVLSSALLEQTVSVPSDIDWTPIFEELKAHAVESLAGDLLEQLSGLGSEERYQWSIQILEQVSRNDRLLYAQYELTQMLKKNQIQVAILKGAAAARYYPQWAYRTLGDIDILVNQEDIERICTLMNQWGYKRIPEKSNVRHIGFEKDGAEFEIHSSLGFLSDLQLSYQFDQYMLDSIKQAQEIYIDGFAVPVLPDISNGLILLAHFSHHLVQYRPALRQVLDWMMFTHNVLDDELWEISFHRQAYNYSLEKLAIALTRMCQIYLGLPVENHRFALAADDTTCHMLMQCVLDCGNFGRKREGASNATVGLLVRNHSVLSWLRSAQMIGLRNWDAVKKYPMLRPFAWCYQLWRFVLKTFERRSKGDFFADIQISKQHTELLQRLHIN